MAEESAVEVEDADVGVGDQQADAAAFAGAADLDVAELAEVAEGDPAGAVDAVLADAEVAGLGRRDGVSLEPGVESDKRGSLAQGAVGAGVVVVGAEGIELELEVGEGGGGSLLGEEAFEGLVEAFDLAAGLGVEGLGVLVLDAEAVELGLEQGFAAARGAGEDGAVVAEPAGGVAELLSGLASDKRTPKPFVADRLGELIERADAEIAELYQGHRRKRPSSSTRSTLGRATTRVRFCWTSLRCLGISRRATSTALT